MLAKARLEALLLQFAFHFVRLRLEVARFVRLEACPSTMSQLKTEL